MVKMRRLKKERKGFLFTIGLTFLVLVVLVLAVLIFHNTQKSEEIISKLAVLDRAYDLDTSIQKSLSDIFNLKSGISINITNNSIVFEEELPNTNTEILNNSIMDFKGFIESNLSSITLDVTNIEEIPLIIMPNNITYKHKENRSNIEVVPEQINFNGYSLFIITDKNVSCSWDVNSGSLNLSLEVKGDVINCDPRTEEIDPSLENEIKVDIIEGGNLAIITVDNNGRLLINLTQDSSVTAKTALLINQSDVEIMTDSLILGIDFEDFGIYKESKVKIT